MKEHVITTEHRTATFNREHEPAMQIEPGDVVTFETGDVAYERLHSGESVEDIGLETFNLVTGPVAVNGAEPGDALVIDVLDVEIRRAWSVWMPEFGGLGKRTGETRTRQINIEGDELRISDELTVPLEPMIGCIGVAPAEGEGSTFQPAYRFGGNMDLRELSPGATIRLPVEVDGGRLSVGDLHAAMGRGEPTWVAIEAAGRARLRVGLEKDAAPPTPRVRIGTTTLCMGIADTLEEAHQSALDQAFDLLITQHGLDPFDANAYASARVGMRLGGPCCPIVMAEVPDPV
ncbi:acetamidase/formamidase [Longibacter salinarum]|uniref:Acetamidase/formamidase n=1 Tax=Longibacter salinarum TaxID=1850348 RepID=A0A2A8CVH0_9BACT|nr:acetamidase/formamidase family protein [Longibacter salinarum]PEN12603.1 acetamidase/formamidase [Longibacter salinarum]